MATLELAGLRLVRSGKEILREIDWTVRPGEHWVLLGANGSGKTSLLKVLTGYEWPTSGTVRVLGKTLGACDVHALRRTIGWASSALAARLHQEDTLLEVALSGFEASIGVYREFTSREGRDACRALALVGLTPLADQPWERCSQGEQQRALIARALVHRPKLLILDEPCAGLDPVARERLLSDLARLAKRRGAPPTIFVTHHIEEIGPWITRAIALRSGFIEAQGLVRDVLTDAILTRVFGRRCRIAWTRDRPSLHLGR